MKRFYRVLLDCNAISLFFIVYLIKKHETVVVIRAELAFLACLIGIMLFTWICIRLSKFLPDEIICGGIKEVELADGAYLPSFLGYFFVALSIDDNITLIAMAVIIFVFTYHSQTLYFNPLFLLFGYRFYNITIDNGMKIFVLTRKPIKNVEGLKFNNLKRINNYTFIDRS